MLNTFRLVDLRKIAGLYQKDMALEIGVERATYAKYETGDIQPPNDMVVKLASFFDVSTDYLLGQSDIKKISSEDEEIWEMRREMAERPEMKTLFSLARSATTEDLEFANNMLKKFARDSGYEVD